MKKWIVGGCLAVASVTFAYTAAVQPARAAASESMAMQLSRLVLSKDTYQQMMKQMISGMMQSMQASGAALPKDADKKLLAVVMEALPYEEMLQFNAQVYGSRFSDKELGDVIAFYKTSTGAKLVRELPNISGDVGAKVGVLLPQRLPALMKKHGLQ